MDEDVKSKTQEKDKLFQAIPFFWKTWRNAAAFLKTCVPSTRINAMAQRLEVAALLKEGETFNKIVDETGASTATISPRQPVPEIWFRRL